MTQLNRQPHLINIKLVTIIVTILIVYVECQLAGFSDQIYTNNNNFQHYRTVNNNNNNNNPKGAIGANLQYANDDLEDKFVIDVKRNKDGKLEPLVRRTPSPAQSGVTSTATASLSPTLSSTLGTSAPSLDVNTRLEKPLKNSGIIHFPTETGYPVMNSVILQQYQTQQQQQLQEQQKILRPQCNTNGIGNSFCTQVDNYPIDAVIKAIQQDSSKFEAVFGEDLVPEPKTEISQRIDPAFGEETLCGSRERLIFPQAGMTKDNNWSFIINHENYTQGIRVEECSRPGRPCSMSENFPNGYRTECKQKFIYRQLLSMTEHGIIKKDLFQLPSCCKCFISKTYL